MPREKRPCPVSEQLCELPAAPGRRVEDRARDRMWQVSEDMLGVADTEGVWVTINPAWTRILGWSAEDILGRTSA